MVKYKKGDLLEATEDIIAHGCNCSGGFGSGVAGQIAKKYPDVRKVYLVKHYQFGWNLGDVQFASIGPGKIIANCATQQGYLPRDFCHADYPAIRRVMETVKDRAKGTGASIAIPRIGAGLAGGDWEVIKAILETVFEDYDVTVYEL